MTFLKSRTMYPFYAIFQFILYKPLMFLAFALIPIIEQGLILVSGLILQGFFNYLSQIGHAPHIQLSQSLWIFLVLYLLVNLIRAATRQLGVVSLVEALFPIVTLLRYNLLERILEHSSSHASTNSVGATISSFRDDPQIAFDLFPVLADVTALIILAIIAFIIMLHVNALVTLLVFLPLAFMITLSEKAKARTVVYRKASREITSQLTGAIGEIFGAVQAIQVAGAEEWIGTHFDAINARRMAMMIKDRVFTDVMLTLMAGSTTIGTGLILIIAALTIRSHPLSLGDLALFVTYLGSVTGIVQGIGNFRTQYIQTSVSFDRMIDAMQDAPPSQLIAHKPLYLRGKEAPTIAALKKTAESRLESLDVSGLTYHYPASNRGIQDINIRIVRGSLTVITGRVGSGKTTCLRVLLGLLPKESGIIRWNDLEIHNPEAFFIPPRSAYTPQVPHLFSDTIKNNILLGLPEDSVDIESALHMAMLERDVHSLEDGLDTVIGVRGVKLSGGQAQRTAASRMFVRTSELLVCDDLSSALDVETEVMLWDRLLASGTNTYLAVSHRRHVLQCADHIIVLKNGHIEAEGSLKALLDGCQEMQYLWHGDIADASS